ncbi:RNA polymerase, sigma 54 (sigma N) factor [Acidithiobacillus ferrivorans]|uniref:RNA polymerase sigma-54 factor n=1 Tax=Acidithiobacillus ferrivorans TaxID=160808 RepID=A0A060UPZ7_9PROT|nr:RNA polymerase factor sigma-54 [Acidithiobacillus ferrivorans]CDQ08644.1 sigma N (sigma 54) factor of RNA polymerase [Acidithiobacillus ferrivorans]SMH66847.1 RNA polymerase, sigma 54 (sigma N) factor [Acidithiobacillus ferrivorans]
MKQGLELKLGQHLAMTPQLQQAIRLLQLSTVDLQQEVQSMLESNPLLDEDAGDEEGGGGPTPETLATPSEDRQLDLAAEDTLPDELPLDSQWDDVFDMGTSGSGGGSDDDMPDFESRSSHSQSLQDYLRWQADMTHFSTDERNIAELIIDAIDERGYLAESLEDLAVNMNVENDALSAVLLRVQDFDPPGVGARDLSECLLLQLKQMVEEDASVLLAQRIVKDHLQALGRHDYPRLCATLGVDEETLRGAMTLISALNPKPGEEVGSESTEYVIPDVIVRWVGKRLRVDLNPEAMPKLRINGRYAGMAGGKDAAHKYIQDQLNEARWFIKSLQSRQETILKVARAIVERQKDFFTNGPESMRPMVLRHIAEAVEMHESTVSRVTNQKYMITPRGLYEFKYFFSSHVSTDSGGSASATAIRALLIKMTQAESARHPLSDAEIAKVLADQGIQIARRTVAKYREAANIPTASQRRRL